MTSPDSPQPKFRRRAEHRPDELLDAALALFVEKGYAHTSVAEIASRAGVSKGALYLYFPSKQAVLEGLVKRAVAPIAAQAVQAADLNTGDMRHALRAILTVVATALSDPGTFAVPKIVIREAVVAPEIAEMYRRAVFDTVLPPATEILRQAVAQGKIRPVDPEMTLRSIIGPVIMHVLLAEIFGIVPEGGLAPERLIANHLDILFNGLFAPTEPSDV
jgi:AcrR family transcriptional regulator